MNIGYLTVSSSSPGSFVDWNWIACQPVAAHTEHCVWTSLDAPLDIRMDGRTGIAAGDEAHGAIIPDNSR